jgi:hypothetical protein
VIGLVASTWALLSLLGNALSLILPAGFRVRLCMCEILSSEQQSGCLHGAMLRRPGTPRNLLLAYFSALSKPSCRAARLLPISKWRRWREPHHCICLLTLVTRLWASHKACSCSVRVFSRCGDPSTAACQPLSCTRQRSVFYEAIGR